MVRYEGPLEHPALAIRRVLEALGLAITPGRLERAVRFSSFSKLSGQERRGGFSERPVHSGNFFRQGISGSWPTALRRSQIERLSKAHGNVMRELEHLYTRRCGADPNKAIRRSLAEALLSHKPK